MPNVGLMFYCYIFNLHQIKKKVQRFTYLKIGPLERCHDFQVTWKLTCKRARYKENEQWQRKDRERRSEDTLERKKDMSPQRHKWWDASKERLQCRRELKKGYLLVAHFGSNENCRTILRVYSGNQRNSTIPVNFLSEEYC